MRLLTILSKGSWFDFGRKSGKQEERERILKAINSWCACEPRKLWACRCDVYVKDLLEELGAGR